MNKTLAPKLKIYQLGPDILIKAGHPIPSGTAHREVTYMSDRVEIPIGHQLSNLILTIRETNIYDK